MTVRRLDKFKSALKRLADNQDVDNEDLFPFDKKYFLEMNMPRTELLKIYR